MGVKDEDGKNVSFATVCKLTGRDRTGPALLPARWEPLGRVEALRVSAVQFRPRPLRAGLSFRLNHRHPVTVDALDAPGDDTAAFHRWTQHKVPLARGARDRGRRIGHHAVDSVRVRGNETFGG